jgi:hypothetical protein
MNQRLTLQDLADIDDEIVALQDSNCDQGGRIAALQAVFEAQCAESLFDHREVEGYAERRRQNAQAAKAVAFTAKTGNISHVGLIAQWDAKKVSA